MAREDVATVLYLCATLEQRLRQIANCPEGADEHAEQQRMVPGQMEPDGGREDEIGDKGDNEDRENGHHQAAREALPGLGGTDLGRELRLAEVMSCQIRR